MNSISLLILLGLITWLWFDTQRSQESAKTICKQICQQFNLQLLDDTIALVRIRWQRSNRGWLQLQRIYEFEFSDSGNNRQLGIIMMRGMVMEMLELPGYLNRIILSV
jgi:hypothetical protein